MRVAGALVLGVACGALAGSALSEVVAVLGLLLFDRPTGLRYLPAVLGVAGGVFALVVVRREARHDREDVR
jgi:hypothetical protein